VWTSGHAGAHHAVAILVSSLAALPTSGVEPLVYSYHAVGPLELPARGHPFTGATLHPTEDKQTIAVIATLIVLVG
jgi:hypothetical protein